MNCESTSAVIVDNGGDEPRPASEITYSIRVNLENGVGQFAGIIPAYRPWAFAGVDLDITPAQVGTEFPAFWWPFQQRLAVYIEEVPACVACESGSGNRGGDEIIVIGGIPGIDAGGGGGGLGGGGGPPSGGGGGGGIGGGGVS